MLPPIYVPSKGRAGKSKTIENLIKEGIPFFVVVEPQEASSYQRAYPNQEINWLILSQSNKGIGFVRNSILQFARASSSEWYWMLDDDISSMSQQVGTKNVKKTFGFVLEEATQLFQSCPDLGQGALEYQQFSWSAKKNLVFNSYCDVAVFINVKRTFHINYRPMVDLKEDRDFTLQILASGLCTARASRFGFAAPKNGSNEGGLKDVYAQSGREVQAVERMCELWPGIVEKQIKPDGRVDCKIHWSLFKKSKGS
jgi:hypothetical protein